MDPGEQAARQHTDEKPTKLSNEKLL